MRCYTLVFALLAGVAVKAQDTSNVYLDANLAITKKLEAAAYTARVWKEPGGGWGCIVFYGANRGLAFTGVFKDKKLTTRHGWFTIYYSDSHGPRYKGRYDEGIPVDTWQSWYENGAKKDSGRLHEGKMTGYWKQWYSNGQPKAAGSLVTDYPLEKLPAEVRRSRLNTSVWLQEQPDINEGLWLQWHDNGARKDSVVYVHGKKEGIYRSWHYNGRLASDGIYNNDLEEATWHWYYDNGQPRTVENYEKGKLKSMQCFDTSGVLQGDFCGINKAALFKDGGPAGFEEYLAKQVRFPPEALAQYAPGVIIVRFVINILGLPEQLEIVDAPSKVFSDEITRILAAMPAWEPAVFHNQPADYEITIRIPHAPYFITR